MRVEFYEKISDPSDVNGEVYDHLIMHSEMECIPRESEVIWWLPNTGPQRRKPSIVTDVCYFISTSMAAYNYAVIYVEDLKEGE